MFPRTQGLNNRSSPRIQIPFPARRRTDLVKSLFHTRIGAGAVSSLALLNCRRRWLQISILEFLPPLGSPDERFRRAFEFRASNSADGTDAVVVGSQPADMVCPPDTLWSCGPRDANGYRYVRVAKTDGQPFAFQEVRAAAYPEQPPTSSVILFLTGSY